MADRDKERYTERENSDSNSKTLFYKDCSLEFRERRQVLVGILILTLRQQHRVNSGREREREHERERENFSVL